MDKKKVFGLILTIILILVGISAVGVGLAKDDAAISPIVKLSVYTITFLYVVCDFKIPHSNSFKLVMLIFGLSLANSVIDYSNNFKGSVASACMLLCVVAAVLVGYMSGRLGKIKKNGFLMALTLVLFLAAALIDIVKSGACGFVAIAEKLSDTITWLVLCTAYVTRFADHKEAGLNADNEGKASEA